MSDEGLKFEGPRTVRTFVKLFQYHLVLIDVNINRKHIKQY